MAKTIAKAIGVDGSGRMKEASRLGHDHSIAQANTWQTFTECVVYGDGHGWVEVKRGGRVLHRFDFAAE